MFTKKLLTNPMIGRLFKTLHICSYGPAVYQFLPSTISISVPTRQIWQSSSAQQRQPDQSAVSPKPDNSSSRNVKEFKDIPGPWTIPYIGLSPEMLQMNPQNMIQGFTKLSLKYGSIFRVKVAPVLPEFVCVFDPEDTKIVYRSEGKYPQRISIDIWEQSRTAIGKPLGIFFLNGEEWHRQRAPMSKFMAVPRKVAEYHEAFNEVTSDLIKSIRRSRDNSDIIIDAIVPLQKWAFEAVNLFVLGKRLGSLDENVPPDCQEFIEATNNFFAASQTLLFGLPFHKIYATRPYKTLLKSFKRIFEISMAHIKERLDELHEEELVIEGEEEGPPLGVDFLTYMSKAGKMSLENITTNAIDLLAAGVDTTSNTLLWTLYCLAVNPEAQDKLREEVMTVVGSDTVITPTHIQQMPFMRDCIKETMRLYSVVPSGSRILDHDVILSGYTVPAGIQIVMPFVSSGALEDNFPEPEKFIPERWSRTNEEPPNPFASLPFGFGARMCVGRRVAELELHVALSQLIKTFRVEFRDDKPMDYIQKLLLSPERRLDLAFVDLKT